MLVWLKDRRAPQTSGPTGGGLEQCSGGPDRLAPGNHSGVPTGVSVSSEWLHDVARTTDLTLRLLLSSHQSGGSICLAVSLSVRRLFLFYILGTGRVQNKLTVRGSFLFIDLDRLSIHPSSLTSLSRPSAIYSLIHLVMYHPLLFRTDGALYVEVCRVNEFTVCVLGIVDPD